MSKAIVLRVILGLLGGLTAAVTAVSNSEALDLKTILMVGGGALLTFVIPYFGDTNGDGKISIADLPKEWQDILAGLAPRPTVPAVEPANSNADAQNVAK